MPMLLFLDQLKLRLEEYDEFPKWKDKIKFIHDITEKQIEKNIKHYNGDMEAATDEYMLNSWFTTLESYILIIKPIELGNVDIKIWRLVLNEIQKIKWS